MNKPVPKEARDMQSIKSKTALFFMVMLVSNIASAATLAVCPSGCAYEKVQDAIDAAADGDTVLVHDGTYVENINFKGRAITVKSMNGAEKTIIDGSQPIDPNRGSVVIFANGEVNDSVLDGFTITGGTGTDSTGNGWPNGGGIYCRNSSPVIRNCMISNNNAENGGGVNSQTLNLPYRHSLTIENCLIYNNKANMGGGVTGSGVDFVIMNSSINNNSARIGGGIVIGSSDLKTTNTVIADNSASAHGGGIFGSSSSYLFVSNSTIKNNKSGEKGGGIFYDYQSSRGPSTILNSSIMGNISSNNGGGVYCFNSSFYIEGCIVSGNKIENNYGSGGGFYGSSSTVINSTFENNSAVSEGGGLYIGGNSYIFGCQINGNSVLSGDGGGIYTPSSVIVNSNIIKNYANRGGGIFTGSNPTIINSTITENEALSNGGAITGRDYASPILINNILWDNLASGNQNEIYLYMTSSITVSHSNIQGGWEGEGNINTNPLFVDSENSNYRLQPGSPCINAGTNTDGIPAEDIEGTIRPQGTGYDMGAYEFQELPDCPHNGDVNQSGAITPQDALMAFQHYLGIIELSQCQQYHADVNPHSIGDGAVTPADALCIFQEYLGLSSCLENSQK